MDKKNTPRSRIRALEKIRNKHIGNDIGTQGKRLLEAMMNESGIWDFALVSEPPAIVDDEDLYI